VPASPEEVDKRVEAALAEWRSAIVIRDADMLLRVEAAFAEAPATYAEALKKSADSDDNERVRAFSTRELGKFKRVDLAPVFRKLLDDTSPFVRKNAAWALGELGSADEGRAAAREAVPKLRQLVKRDRADEVRAAARATLDRLE
jgi:HEAT repeat protein